MGRTSSRYPHVIVRGTPFEMGLRIGERFRGELRAFLDLTRSRLMDHFGVDSAAAERVVNQAIVETQRFHPASFAELDGLAVGSGITVADAMLLNVRNQFTSRPGGCSAISLTPPVAAEPMLAQNWDNDPATDPFTIVLTRLPTDGTAASICVTQIGLVAYIGMNDAGVGVTLNALPVEPRGSGGIPHYVLVRAVLESRHADQATEVFASATPAIAANLLLSTPQGPRDLEIAGDRFAVIEPDRAGLLTHTNHFESPALAGRVPEGPELIESRPRKARLGALLDAIDTPIRVEDLQRLFADHAGYPRSVCRHANDGRHGHWETVFSVIMAPARGEVLVCRGSPCEQSFHRYPFRIDEGAADVDV